MGTYDIDISRFHLFAFQGHLFDMVYTSKVHEWALAC